MDLLLEAIKLSSSFREVGYPTYFLYVVIILPFLLFLSEIMIRKVIRQPFTSKLEMLHTFGYLIIGVVVFSTVFVWNVSLMQSFVSIPWTPEEVLWIGVVVLFLFTLLSPFSMLYVRMKTKVLQFLYVATSSVIFAYLIEKVSTFTFELRIPAYFYAGFGIVYFVTIHLIANINLAKKASS